MVKRILSLTLCVLVVAALSVPALSGEVISITEQGLPDTPAMVPRYTDPPWGTDFRANPALLSLDTPYRLILDGYYTGGIRHLSTDIHGGTAGFNLFIPSLSPGNTVGHREMDYYARGLEGDTGFALKLTEGTNLAGLFTYRWDKLSGSGEFASESQAEFSILGIVFPLRSSFVGTTEERLDAHTFGVSLLLSREVSKDLTLGTGLKYSFRTETFGLDESGFGTLFLLGAGIPENVDVSKDLTLRTHEIAPVLGIKYHPTERVSLDGSLEVGFTTGSVSKDSSLFDDNSPVPPYTEDLDSNNLFGWRLTAALRPEFSITDKLSVPVVLGASYRDLSWSVDGASTGVFAPVSYLDVYYGQGTSEYENNVTAWGLTAGAGLTYRADWGVLSGLLSYVHTGLRNAWAQENFDTGFGVGLTALGTRDTEARDVLSLSLSFEKTFSETLAANLGLRYDVGWARRDYYLSYSSLYESPGQLIIDTDGCDTYQGLTLNASLTMRPVDGLDLSFGGMVRAPLDPLDYELDGDATGLENMFGSLSRFQARYSGPLVRGSETTGWDWGGWFYLTYEFGAAAAVPPAAPEAPKVSPSIIEMGKR